MKELGRQFELFKAEVDPKLEKLKQLVGYVDEFKRKYSKSEFSLTGEIPHILC